MLTRFSYGRDGRTDGQTDGQPENIMPPGPTGRRHKNDAVYCSFNVFKVYLCKIDSETAEILTRAPGGFNAHLN